MGLVQFVMETVGRVVVVGHSEATRRGRMRTDPVDIFTPAMLPIWLPPIGQVARTVVILARVQVRGWLIDGWRSVFWMLRSELIGTGFTQRT